MAKQKLFKSFTPLTKAKKAVKRQSKAFKPKSDTAISKAINKRVHHASKVFSFSNLFNKLSIKIC